MTAFVMRRQDFLEVTGHKTAAEALALMTHWWKKFPRKLKITQQQIADHLNCHRQTAAKGLQILVDLEFISWELNENDRQSQTRRYVVNMGKIAEIFPEFLSTLKGEKPTRKGEKPTGDVEKSTSQYIEIDPSIVNPSKIDPPILLRREEEKNQEEGVTELENQDKDLDLDVAGTEKIKQGESQDMNVHGEDHFSAAKNFETKKVRVVDSRLGFGDGSNFRQTSQRSQAARYVAEKVIESETAREFQRQFGQWEMLQGVEPRYSKVSAVLRQVEAGEFVLEWEEFEQGIPMGTLNKQPWHYLRGLTYPFVLQYCARQSQKPDESFTQALSKARSLFKDPVAAQQAWEDWGRRIVNAHFETERLKALGVQSITMPVELKELKSPGTEEVAIALRSLVVQDTATISPSNQEEQEVPVLAPQSSNFTMNPSEAFLDAYKKLVGKTTISPPQEDTLKELERLNADLADPLLRRDRSAQAKASRFIQSKGKNFVAEYDDQGLICALVSTNLPYSKPKSEFEILTKQLSSKFWDSLQVQQEVQRFVDSNNSWCLASRNAEGLITEIREPDF